MTAPITENLNHLATVRADAVIEGRDAGIYGVKPPDLHRQGDLWNTRPSRIWLKPQSGYTATSINPHHLHSCRTSIRIRAPGGAEVIVVVPIAGLLARRMVCDVPVGDKLSIGGTYGLIGSDPGWTTTSPQERTRWSAAGNARLRVKRC